MYKVLDRDTIKTLEHKIAQLEERYPSIFVAREQGYDENIPQRFVVFADEAEQAIDYIRQIGHIIAQHEGFRSGDDPGWRRQLTVGEANRW